MKRFAIILSIILSLVPMHVYAQSPAIDAGLGYLYSNQNPDRSWGGAGSSTGTVASTVTVLQTLQQIGDTDRYEYLGALSWLQAQGLDTTENVSERILTLTAGGTDADKLISYLDKLVNAWGGYGEYGVNIIDTVYAIQALKTINYSDAAVFSSALNFLTANQNADGSWGFYKGDSGNPHVTSRVLITLAKFKTSFPTLQPSINKAVAYLRTKQNPDGGFGSSPSTVHETALAYEALVTSGTDVSASIPLAVNYLTSAQQANGSWANDPYSTALAMQALNNVKANLSVSAADIAFSDTKLTAGEQITITALVRNTGMVAANQVFVNIYDNDPTKGASAFSSQIIGTIASGATVTLSVPYTVSGSGGRTCFVWIDPQNRIPEVTKADNIASKSFWASTWPDLALFPEDVKPSATYPAVGAPFDISFKIRNLGETEAYPVNTALYDGNPAQGGTPIAYGMPTTVKPGEVRSNVIVGAVLNTAGVHTLYLVTNYDHQIQESTETNNTVSLTVNVGGSAPTVDLSLSSMDFSITSKRPLTGETVQLAALVRNPGLSPAYNFLVEFFDGDPSVHGQLIASQTISLAAGAEQNVTASWTMPAGIHTIYAIVDRANSIAETNKLNNQASIPVMADMVDISLSATDLSLEPSHPVAGDTVTFSIIARNTGIIATNAFNLALYDGDPNNGGVLLQTFPISSIAGDGSATITYTFTAVPKTYRFYAVADTENVVVEMSETNNTAIRSLKIKAPGEILGPDLVPIKIDLSDTTTDPLTLSVSGTAHVTVQNKGDDKITTSFSAIIFEDKDNDAKYTAGVDNLLGTGTLATGPTTSFPAIWPEGANVVDVPLSGTVKFLHSPVYAMVDSSDAILEQNETNNLLISCKDCEARPASPIQPVVKWSWKQANMGYNISVLYGPPIITYLTDNNGDGKIDEKDTPSVVVNIAGDTYNEYLYGPYKVLALRGDTGAQIFKQYYPEHPIAINTYLAAGDIDGDGKAEVLVNRRSLNGDGGGGLVALKNDGTLLWDNLPLVYAWDRDPAHPYNKSGLSNNSNIPALADLDGDGRPEIFAGRALFNGDGTVRCAFDERTGNGWASDEFSHSIIVADLDMDGRQDILAGTTAYNNDCSVKWWNQSLPDGLTAIGNFNGDSYPEIVFATDYVRPGEPMSARLYLLDHIGNVIWGPVLLSQFTGGTWAHINHPLVADFDGDGKPEIGIRQRDTYLIFDGQGNLKRTITMPKTVPGMESYTTSPTVFDLNGDGKPELLINTGGYFTIFDPVTGDIVYRDQFGMCTGGSCYTFGSANYQNVRIADVNGDGHAEIIASGFDNSNFDAIRVYGSANNDWVPARKIWNQASYHVTNVNDDGSIPKNEAQSWLLNNTYRTQAAIGPIVNPYLTPNLTASYLRASQNSSGVHMTVRIGNGGAKEAAIGATVTFYDGNPTSGTIIGTSATTKILQIGDYEDISLDWKGGSAGVHDIYAVVNSAHTVSECNFDDNHVMVSLTVQGSGAVFGPDLIPIRLDVSSATTDPVTLLVSGTARVTLQNTGDATISTPFSALVFEDIDGDGRYTSGVDISLGTGTNTHTLLPNGAFIVEVPLTGRVAYVGAMLSAMVDSGDAISEQNENNNVLRAASACEARPVSPIQPVVKWRIKPTTLSYGIHPPVIALLTDDNGDGKINQLDVPSIIYFEYPSIVARRGDTGVLIFTIPNTTAATAYAVGDIDGDGYPEIIIPRSDIGVRVYDHTGVQKWDNYDAILAWQQTRPGLNLANTNAIPVIADLDGDGNPEIITGPTAINADGTVKWGKDFRYSARGQFATWNSTAVVADLDLDGKQEVIVGNTVYNHDGTVRWSKTALPDGINAVGNFDNEAYPEIVLVAPAVQDTHVYLLDRDGNIKWGPKSLKALEPSATSYGLGGPPVIADFDGDGEPEIGVKGFNTYFILDKNGNLKNTLPIPYASDGSYSAPTVFDLNGDGRPKVLINSDGYFRIFEGRDGTLLYTDRFGGGFNSYQNVIVADVDGDGHAEAVVVGYDNSNAGDIIRIYGSTNNDWAPARKIWNQASYHVTNVNDDGAIPRNEAPSWLTNNTYRCQAATSVVSSPTGTNYSLPNLTASYLRASYDGSGIDMLVRVANSGAKEAPAGAVATFYDGAPATETIIGTVPITRVLRPGEYQDIAYSMTSATPGVHHLYATVNDCLNGSNCSNRIAECNYSDNQVQLDYTVQATYPDLTIRTEEISLPTGTIYEGNLVPITAVVRNIGAVSADNVNVRLYNGNPANAGTPVGLDQYISSLSSGATTTLVFTYDTLSHGGNNVLYIVADPAAAITETNKANNSASLSLNVQPPVLPDLAVFVSNIQIAPIAPTEGDGVIITTTITNRGAAVGNVPVKITVTGSGGQGTGSSESYNTTKMIYPVLNLGQTATVQTVLPTAGLAGQQTVAVTVDPMSTIFELSKDNNIATTQLFIQSAGLATAVALNKQTYQANELVNAAVTITNTLNDARSLMPDIFVKDSVGNRIATISQGTGVTVNANSSITLTHTWNTGATLAGNYLFATELTEGTESKVISKATTSFAIAANQSVETKVVTDKISYEPNQTATLTSTLISRSTNTIMENLVARITINSNSSNNSNTPVHTETKAISTLMPNASFTFKTYWNTGTYPAGTYPVTLEIRDASNALISTATLNLVISSTVRPSQQLRGAISVDHQSIMTGETVTTSYSVTNIGNLDLSDVAITVLTINTNNLQVYNTLASQATLTMGSSYQQNNPITALNYPAKDYLVVLRAKIGDIEETLGGTYLRVEGAPTAPSLLLPTMGSDVDTVTPLLTVNNASDPNDDKLTYEFELYSDSGLTQLVASSGLISEGTSTTSWTVPVTLVENSTYYWRSRAFDTKLYGAWMDAATFRVNTINDPPSAPILSSPVNNGIVSSLTPTLTVINATDPDSPSLTYNFELYSDSSLAQLVAVGSGVMGQGAGTTSWQVPISLTENMTYYWRAQADDWLIDGPWSTTGSFFVNTANDAPSMPVITAPANGANVSTTSVDIVLANSTDPDSPGLTYTFELDTIMSFNSATIMRSGNIQQGQNSTIWNVSGLIEDTQYYVRAKASDGQAESDWSGITGFFISTTNSAPSAPTLNNPGNNAAVNVFTPTLSVQNATDPDRDVLTYTFEVYSDHALTSLVTSTSGVPAGSGVMGQGSGITTWTVPVALTENQTYYWRARSNDGSLNSPWMTTAAFFINTANDAPGAPVLLTPTDGSTVTTLTPVLTITNATDPDNDALTYEFEVYQNSTLVATGAGVMGQGAGTTSWTVTTALTNNTVYTWRVRAYDGDRFGPWTAMATFTVHLTQTSITVDIDFEPETLNKKDHGKWVLAKIELPHGYKAKDVDISSIRLEGTVHAELWPHTYHHHHHKHGCHHDRHGHHHEVLMVKFKRSEVIAVLPEGKHVPVHVTGSINTTLFEGVDVIRVINKGHDCGGH